jgi:hypothetical protein
MSYATNRQEYLELIQDLVKRRLSGPDFVQRFGVLWRSDRDEELAIASTWPRRYDIELAEALARGDMGADEFAAKWEELWGYEGESAYRQMLDRIFSACSAFVDDPALAVDPEREYDEEELCAHVAAVLQRVNDDVIASTDHVGSTEA